MSYSKADLAIAERHVRLGEEHVTRQRAIVSELTRDGHPTELAKELLQLFESTLESLRAHRDAIEADLRDKPLLDQGSASGTFTPSARGQ